MTNGVVDPAGFHVTVLLSIIAVPPYLDWSDVHDTNVQGNFSL